MMIKILWRRPFSSVGKVLVGKLGSNGQAEPQTTVLRTIWLDHAGL